MASKIKAETDERTKLLMDEFTTYSRKPFIEILSHLAKCAPDEKELQIFANQYPDRWANAVSTFARLSGYHEKLEIKGNIFLQINNMGDAELMQHLEEINSKLIDLEAEDITTAECGDALPNDETKEITLSETIDSEALHVAKGDE